MPSDDNVKARIEAEYERDEETDEVSHDYAGQLTILFCGDDPYSSGYQLD